MRIQERGLIEFNDAIIKSIIDPYNEIVEAARTMHIVSLQPLKELKLKEIRSLVKKVAKNKLGKTTKTSQFATDFINELRVHTYVKTKFSDQEYWWKMHLVYKNLEIGVEEDVNKARHSKDVKSRQNFLLLAGVCFFSLAMYYHYNPNYTRHLELHTAPWVKTPINDNHHMGLYLLSGLCILIGMCGSYPKNLASSYHEEQKATSSFYINEYFHSDVLNALKVSTEFYKKTVSQRSDILQESENLQPQQRRAKS
jgi:hypothetical protein